MLTMQFTYLSLRARGEVSRMIMAYGDIEYDDNVISLRDWPSCKFDTSISYFNQLPSLTLPNGIMINQSGAIDRYLAKLAGVYPENIEEVALADMVYELAQEMCAISHILNIHPKDSDTFKAEYEKYFKIFPNRIVAVQKLLGDRKYFGGEKPSYADFGFFHIIDASLTVKPSCLNDFEVIKVWYDRFSNIPSVRKYLAERTPRGLALGRPNSIIQSDV